MTVQVQITGPGIYNGKGEQIEVGTVLTLSEEPKAWRGRYAVISEGGEDKVAVTNPATEAGLKAEHHGGGKFKITRGEETILNGLSKVDADAFNALSDEDKAAFVNEQAKG